MDSWLFHLFVFVLVLKRICSECNETDHWSRIQTLDLNNKVKLYWNLTDTNLTVLMVGQTKGWLGIGFSPSGGMTGADIVVGWMEGSQPHLQDLYASHNGKPHVDDIQSYQLLGGRRNESHLFICWTRKFNTCDKQDFRITNDTIRVIWAWNDNSTNMLTAGPQYHGPKRGVKSLRLTGSDFRINPPKHEEHLDLLSPDFAVPNNTDTMYWCQFFKYPKTWKKYHVIGFKPLVQKGSEDLVHHMLIYECPLREYSEIRKMWNPKQGFECLSPENKNRSINCDNTRIAWAVGSEGEYYPPDVGFDWGSRERDVWYRLEIHYSIKNKHHGIVDRSGIRLYLTSSLRKYEGGNIAIGTNPLHLQIIPPHQKEFPTIGICPSECISKVFPTDGVRVLNLFYHTHLTGKKIRLHRYRNGVELKPFTDENYDFNYQQPYQLAEELRILPNDTLVVECIGNTMDRKNATLNGISTKEEMCLIFIDYYPRVNLSWCNSNIKEDLVYNLTGIEVWQNSSSIKEPEEYQNMSVTDYLKIYNWTEDKITTLKDLNYYSYQKPYCTNFEGDMPNINEVRFPYDAKVFKTADEC